MQKRFFLAPAAIMAFILFFTVFGDRGLLMISRLHRDRDDMQQRLTDLKGENEKLKREIAALQSDRRYLESIARRDFGLVRSNETIYQFPQEKAEQKPQQKGEQKVEQRAEQKVELVQQKVEQKAPAKVEQKAPAKAEHKVKAEHKPAAPVKH